MVLLSSLLGNEIKVCLAFSFVIWLSLSNSLWNMIDTFSTGRGTEARAFGDRGRRMVNTGTQCGKQVLTSSTCTNHQRTSCGHEVTSIKNYQLFMKHYSLRCIILQTSGFCQCTDKADQEIVKEQLCQCLNNIKSVFHLIWWQLVCVLQQISDSNLTTRKEGTAHSEGVSSNTASHLGEPMGKK